MLTSSRRVIEESPPSDVWAPKLLECPPARLDEMFALRAAVWIGEGATPTAFPAGEWRDHHDALRRHWVVVDQDRFVATASLSIHDRLADVEDGHAYISAGLSSAGHVAAPARVAVLPEYRGRGLVQTLLDIQDRAARDGGATLAVRQASPAMVRILLRRGWRAHGPGPADSRFPIEFTLMSRLIAVKGEGGSTSAE